MWHRYTVIAVRFTWKPVVETLQTFKASHVVLCRRMLYKVVTFKFVDETAVCNHTHSNESY